MTNLRAAPFNESLVKTELEKARQRLGVSSTQNGLGTPAEYREQAALYDTIAETELVMTWDARLRLARAAVALRIAANRFEGTGI